MHDVFRKIIFDLISEKDINDTFDKDTSPSLFSSLAEKHIKKLLFPSVYMYPFPTFTFIMVGKNRTTIESVENTYTCLPASEPFTYLEPFKCDI